MLNADFSVNISPPRPSRILAAASFDPISRTTLEGLMNRRSEIIAVMASVAVLAVALVSGTISQAAAPSAPKATAMAGDFHIQDAWARINPVKGRPSSVYVTIHYGGTKPDMLVSASTPIAGRVELHNHTMTGNIMRMVKVPGIAIAADSETKLAPSGYHLMLFDMKAAPKPGSTAPLTLTFKSGTRLTLLMTAQGITANGPDGKGKPIMHMDDHRGHNMKITGQ
jgi:periplasmic copper chaperone A